MAADSNGGSIGRGGWNVRGVWPWRGVRWAVSSRFFAEIKLIFRTRAIGVVFSPKFRHLGFVFITFGSRANL